MNTSGAAQIRMGIGYDSHPFEAGRPLILGGVEVPSERGLAGHSDADVLTHAVIDALLGAAGLGDIGAHFPADDDRWKDSASLDLAARTVALLADEGWRVVNVDVTVVLEAPRIDAHRDEMRRRLAAALSAGEDAVSVKATTNEGMGFVGSGEGAAAIAAAAITRD